MCYGIEAVTNWSVEASRINITNFQANAFYSLAPRHDTISSEFNWIYVSLRKITIFEPIFERFNFQYTQVGSWKMNFDLKLFKIRMNKI